MIQIIKTEWNLLIHFYDTFSRELRQMKILFVFPYPPFFVYNNKKEIQHHCKKQRKDYIRTEQNARKKNVVDIQLKKKKRETQNQAPLRAYT